MAVLKNWQSGNITLLNARHIVGRNKHTSHTYVPENDVSQSHASIKWVSGFWQISDHSRNGTLVNEKYIHHDTMKLSEGDTLQFGRDKSAKWILTDASAPASYLKSLEDTDKVMALTPAPGIPTPDHSEISFFYANDHQWKAEKAGDLIDLTHGMVIELNNENWMFIENDVIDETINYAQLTTQAHFQFNLSADEERIRIKIIVNELELDMGERVYHYMLLALARKRLADAQLDYVYPDQGWIAIDDLTHDLSKELQKEVDAYYLNLQIYRLRKQLLEMEPLGYLFSNIIERRKGEIRFAYRYFCILKEERSIGEVLPEKPSAQKAG